jgi:hypothetical protein
MSTRAARLIAASAVASLALTGSAQARHGADDPAGHVRHSGGADDAQPHAKRAKKHRRHRHFEARHARRGVDDRAADQRRGGGADDPAGHR